MSGLDPLLLLRGYAAGIFPMADSREASDIFWVEPRTRAILPLAEFHLSRSLARRLRSPRFRVTLDTAFEQVVLACAARDETWINSAIERATRARDHLGGDVLPGRGLDLAEDALGRGAVRARGPRRRRHGPDGQRRDHRERAEDRPRLPPAHLHRNELLPPPGRGNPCRAAR